jgi:hypothetical protein
MRVGMVLISLAFGRWHSPRSNTVLRAATYTPADTNSKVEKGHALSMNGICSLLVPAYLGFRIECENSMGPDAKPLDRMTIGLNRHRFSG